MTTCQSRCNFLLGTMRYRLEEPLFTTVLSDTSAFVPIDSSLYIYGETPEARSTHVASWQASFPSVTFMNVASDGRSAINATVSNQTAKVNVRSSTGLLELMDQRTAAAVYLDITGLSHNVWAPLLKAMRTRGAPAYAVYVEPGDYNFSASPTDVTLFDLSEKIEGISPLPGFVTLARAEDEGFLFVPLLGFEGARFAFMLESVQPKREDICPVVGVPGFRPEYPFFTYLGNRLKLSETRAWQNVRFAAANCPFSAYNVMTALLEEHPSKQLRLGLIGTKPHALGAVLFHLDHPAHTELLYDHPVRKDKRTTGVSRICIYDLSLLPPIRPERSL